MPGPRSPELDQGGRPVASLFATAPPVLKEHEDGWHLIAAAQDGDQAAFGELYDRYVDVILPWIGRFWHGAALAEEQHEEASRGPERSHPSQ